MKMNSDDVIRYGGCGKLYRFFVRTYGKDTYVDVEQFDSDFKEFLKLLPDDDGREWINWEIKRNFFDNWEAVENCGESVVYFDEYKATFNDIEIISSTPEEVKSKVVEQIENEMGDIYDFFRVSMKVEMELFGQKGIGYLDIDDPRADKLKIISYSIIKRDASEIETFTLDEFNTNLEEVKSEYIKETVSIYPIYQKIVADEKYEAWKPIA